LFALSVFLIGSGIPTVDGADRVARVAYVDPESRANAVWGWPAFWKRLNELGWAEGRNLVVEARFAEGHTERLPQLFSEVAASNVDVIFTYTTAAALVAKGATTTIPIVFAGVIDPVGSGLVTSLPRPGGNVTGLSATWSEGGASKLLELLQDTVPRLSTVAIVSGPEDKSYAFIADQLRSAAIQRGIRLHFLPVSKESELGRVFREARREAQAVFVLSDPFTYSHRRQILALAAANHLPDVYGVTENVALGGLMAYGADAVAMWRRAAEYVDRILRGSKPADLPVEIGRVKLALNMRTARSLGISVPESILLRADEVIK
jgi:putative ABC transport system substrate-binding protein